MSTSVQVIGSPQVQLSSLLKAQARTFPYDKYADLMTHVSVDGIKPGELCVVVHPNFQISREALELYDSLLQKGYTVRAVVSPIDVEKIIWQKATPKMKKEYKAHHIWLGKEYDHILYARGDTEPRVPDKWFDFAKPVYPSVNSLLKRQAKNGESIQLYITTDDSDKLIEEIVNRIVDKKGIPYLSGSNAELAHHLYINAQNDSQLSFVRPDSLVLNQTVQKRFSILNTSDDTYARIEIPPDDMGKSEYDRRKTLSLKAGGAATRPFMDRMARVELGPRPADKLFRTLGLTPSLDLAEELGFPRTQEGLDAFGEFYSQITHMDEVDPIAYYKKMMPLVDHYAKQLRKFHTIKVQTDNGKTNVTFSIRDKGEKESRYVASSTVTGNALPGEIFTSPVEDSVNGQVYFDLPFVLDNIVFQGLTLTFKDGQIVNVNADKGDLEHLQGRVLGIGPKANLKIDNFDRLGEFAIGFNRKITQLMKGRAVTNTLISEKQDLHFAIGDGYPNTGGKNKCDLHVDIPVNSGPDSGLLISGLHDSSSEFMPIYREGKFFDAFLDFNTDFNWRGYGDIKWD